jgi:hypothetical protein
MKGKCEVAVEEFYLYILANVFTEDEVEGALLESLNLLLF